MLSIRRYAHLLRVDLDAQGVAHISPAPLAVSYEFNLSNLMLSDRIVHRIGANVYGILLYYLILSYRIVSYRILYYIILSYSILYYHMFLS